MAYGRSGLRYVVSISGEDIREAIKELNKADAKILWREQQKERLDKYLNNT